MTSPYAAYSRVGRSGEPPTRTFTFKGQTFTLSAWPDGEAYFRILYPDPDAALKQCTAWALSNERMAPDGKIDTYPIDIWGDVMAIAICTPGWEEMFGYGEIFSLYDSEPALFSLLRYHALILLGIRQEDETFSPIEALFGAYQQCRKASDALLHDRPGNAREFISAAILVLRSALEGSGHALPVFTGDDHPDDVDALMEAHLGNSPAGQSSGPAQTSNTGPTEPESIPLES